MDKYEYLMQSAKIVDTFSPAVSNAFNINQASPAFTALISAVQEMQANINVQCQPFIQAQQKVSAQIASVMAPVAESIATINATFAPAINTISEINANLIQLQSTYARIFTPSEDFIRLAQTWQEVSRNIRIQSASIAASAAVLSALYSDYSPKKENGPAAPNKKEKPPVDELVKTFKQTFSATSAEKGVELHHDSTLGSIVQPIVPLKVENDLQVPELQWTKMVRVAQKESERNPDLAAFNFNPHNFELLQDLWYGKIILAKDKIEKELAYAFIEAFAITVAMCNGVPDSTDVFANIFGKILVVILKMHFGD